MKKLNKTKYTMIATSVALAVSLFTMHSYEITPKGIFIEKPYTSRDSTMPENSSENPEQADPSGLSEGLTESHIQGYGSDMPEKKEWPTSPSRHAGKRDAGIINTEKTETVEIGSDKETSVGVKTTEVKAAEVKATGAKAIEVKTVESSTAETVQINTATAAKITVQSAEVANDTANDVDLLARLIMAEAQGEPYDAKVAVGSVVMNRVKSGAFPDTISQVIYQEINGHIQFTPVANRWIDKPANADCIKAAKEAMAGADATNGALFYYDTTTTNSWILEKKVSIQLGNMIYAY